MAEQSIAEDAEVESTKGPSVNFYATGRDGKALKLHQRVASVAIGMGGQQWQEAFEDEIEEYTDEQIIAMAPFDFVGRGIAGIDEMAKVLDDSQVYFGVLQIQIGEGTFARYKNIFIHFLGEKMKAIARAKANRRLALAKDIIGACNAPLVVTNAEQFTVEWVFEELKRVFEGDNIAYKGKGQMTDLNTLRVNYKARMEKAKEEAEQERQRMLLEKEQMNKEAKHRAVEEEQRRLQELKLETAAKKRAMEEEKKRKAEEERRLRHEREEQERAQRREAEKQRIEAEMATNPDAKVEDLKPKKKKKKGRKRKKKDDWSDDRPWTPERVLNCIHSDISPFNWGLFKPSQKEVKPIKWGHGNLAVLRAELKDDQVQYGLMRLSFGSGRFRRNFWIYFLWTPDTMTNEHKKGRLRSKHVSFNGEMQRLLSPWTIPLTVETKEKVTIRDWVMRVKRTVVIDGDDDMFTEAEFQKALEEEARYIAEVKAKEEAAKIARDKQEQIEKLKNMKEETIARKQKAERRQSAEFSKLNLKTVKVNLGMPAHETQWSATPIPDHDGHYSAPPSFANLPDQKTQDADDNKGASGDEDEDDEDDEEEVPREPSPEPVIELSAEELATLEAERQQKEEIELAKRRENELKYRDVLQSKLVLESVELVKRTSERLCWVLFAPQRLNQ